MASSVISDAYILPNVHCKVDDTWTIYGQDLQPILDPSLRSTITGSLTARRGVDGGTADAPTAEIHLDKGVLDLHDADGKTETNAKWAPRGKMVFSFKDGIVTSGDLGGDFIIENRSTDHILFEAKMSTKPDYRITYSCEVMK
jgi:hypothetical protein